jgi:adenine-specific DNA-methyltransferase
LRPIGFDATPDIQKDFGPTFQIVLHPGNVNDFLPTVPDESVKLIVTSPPYNIGKSYETKVEIEKYLAGQADTIKQLHRVLHPSGSICWQVGNFVEKGEIFPLDIFYYQIFKALGMKLRNRIVWRFGHGLHASKRLSGRYETLLWFTKTDEYTFNLDDIRVPSKYPGKTYYKGPKKGQPSGNPKGKNPSDMWVVVQQDWEEEVWDIPNCKANHPEKTIHPAQFPIELAERCVLAFTKKGDWVFDPYAGVGSTIIAAIKHERRGMGCEKEKEYSEIAKDRIRRFYRGTLPMRSIGTPVFEPTGKEKVAQVPKEWMRSMLDEEATG